jgi:hypothetical protein
VQRIQIVRRLVISAALASLAIGTALGSSPSAQAVATRTTVPLTSFTVAGSIGGIAATSPTSAWAVGESDSRVLIAHWNGARWTRDKSFEPAGQLYAISMDSPTDAWAVGEDYSTASWLVVHWNGKTWSRDTSVPKVKGSLTAVVAVGGDVWVAAWGPVGVTGAPLMLHRTAGRWYVVPVPGSVYVTSFAALSRDSIWAASEDTPTRLLHWNGSMWKTTAVPRWASQVNLADLAPGPDGSVWAIGQDFNFDWFSMHWNGKVWANVATPTLEPGLHPIAVTSIPGGTAWAVGGADCPAASCGASPPLILHWSGKAWTLVKSVVLPGAAASELASLDAVTVISPSNAWAAGQACTGLYCQESTTLILHWNGKTWS